MAKNCCVIAVRSTMTVYVGLMLPDKQFLCPAAPCGCRRLGCCTSLMPGQRAAGPRAPPRRRQDGVVNRDVWGRWGSSLCPRIEAKLTVATPKSRCPYPCGQLCKSGLLGKGERRAVRGDLECRRGFPTVGKGARGLAGGGREHRRNIQLVEGAFVKFLRYLARRNQVGDRKEDCIWLEEIKGWEGSGKLCSLRISVCLDGDLFLLPVFPFRNHLFFFPHIPAAEYLLGPVGLLSPSSHNDVLLSKKPRSPPAKSPSFCNSPYSPTCSPAAVLCDRRGEPGKAAPDQVALEILVFALGIPASLLPGEGMASISSHA